MKRISQKQDRNECGGSMRPTWVTWRPFINTNSRKLLSHNDSFVLPKDMSPTRISILFWAQIYAILFYQEIFFFEHIFFVSYLLVFGQINITWECSIFSLGRRVVFMLCFVLCRPVSSCYELEHETHDISFCKPGPEQRIHRLW